jgi:Putative metal-binding motif
MAIPRMPVPILAVLLIIIGVAPAASQDSSTTPPLITTLPTTVWSFPQSSTAPAADKAVKERLESRARQLQDAESAARRQMLGNWAERMTQQREEQHIGPRNNVPRTTGTLDCNDNNRWINPAAQEVCNGVDDNCDGDVDSYRLRINGQEVTVDLLTQIFADRDGDGYGDPFDTQRICLAGNELEKRSAELARSSHKKGAKYVLVGGDCDDGNANKNPNTGDRCE